MYSKEGFSFILQVGAHPLTLRAVFWITGLMPEPIVAKQGSQKKELQSRV